jgi:Mat/Ecp fimbriae major subunit
MLNKMKIVLAGAAAVAAMSSTAAYADTENATATVQILGAVELTKFADLDLGTVASGAAVGTVALPTSSNTRTCTGVTCVGTASRARFQVTAATNGYVIAVSHSPTATLTGPGASMSFGFDDHLQLGFARRHLRWRHADRWREPGCWHL